MSEVADDPRGGGGSGGARGQRSGQRGGGGGGNKGRVNRSGNHDAAPGEVNEPPRLSALGNPLPALKKEAVPSVSNVDSTPKISAPPSVMRSNSQSSVVSNATNQSDRSRGAGGGGGTRRSQRSGGGGGGGTPHGGAERDSHPSAPRVQASMPKWPNIAHRVQADVQVMPSAPVPGSAGETINVANWGDVEEESVTQEVIETRLRNQLERARTEKLAIQKQLADAQAALENAKAETAKFKAEADQMRSQLDKAAMMEKSYNNLRVTRDTLETERDNVKKSLVKAEKDLKSVKEDSEKVITKLKMEIDTLNAQIEYQKIELEDARQGKPVTVSAGTTPALTTWLCACPAGASLERLADTLEFSNLEISRLNSALWESHGEDGFRQSLAALTFERGGERLNPASTSFSQDAREAVSRVIGSTEVLLYLPRKSASMEAQTYDLYVNQLVHIFADTHSAGRAPKHFALVLEDYPLNRVTYDGRRFVPVSFLSL